ncbi:hypothetical protein E3N88_09301 [Mikania micrantha]|uniref:Uncharacterized protein n=1 Tax=Mikania micrantha TaxID=192012 RepID=A0A5N6PLR3_9ASTR|nr:hypothetical protein E3N88_09301 [Mikania micrantha]
MMNVGENRARNGVTGCPESKNEEKFLSIELLDSSRYAKDGLRVLGGTRWSKKISDFSGFLRGTRSLDLLFVAMKNNHFGPPIFILRPSDCMDRTKDRVYKF